MAGKGKTPANRDKLGRFVKGQSGNPNGRPSLPKELIQYARESPQRIREIADVSKDLKLKFEIEKWFAEMYYGKPGQRVEVEGDMAVAANTVITFEGDLAEWSK